MRTLGFEVTLATNLNLQQMKNKLGQLRKKLRQHKQAVGLFYFAGHGVRDGDHNYLIPVGANDDLMQEWQTIHVSQIDEWKKELETAAMKTAYVSNMMKIAGNQTNLIILDACRNSPFTQVRGLQTGQIALPSGFNKEIAAPGFLIAYAASPGEAAAYGTGDNSPYIKYLVKWIQEPNMRIIDILRKVRKGVKRDTNGKQNPVYDLCH
ncbi:MAG: caspase family protein [Pseudomonadota bacterium]